MPWSGSFANAKKTIAFSAGDFLKATICSHITVVLNFFLHLAVYFPKTMKATAAINKRPHQVRELKVHTAG